MNTIIVGGGITGLSAAWFLLKKNPKAKITLLEKENRLGGWIRTCNEGGFLFEKGPRTFPFSRNPHLLELIQDLKLELISSEPAAAKRFILHKGHLRTPGSFLPTLIPYLIRELFIRPSTSDDESIYDFAARRFSPKIAETFFDPLTLGIYSGDIRKLSIRACFPALYKWEREKGSVVRGLFSSPKNKSKAKGLFTVKSGMETLIHELEKKLPIDIVLNCSVEKFSEHEVIAGGKTYHADRVISALPPQYSNRSIWVVNLAYAGDVLVKKGYGYLVPTQEKESLLGVIFDSAIFPQQNRTSETRLTAMVRPEEKEPLKAALNALERHLGINAQPVHTSTFLAKNAIPQFEVGCTYTDGVSVDACIQKAAKLISPR
ncbi:MAG: protoporphyrinogen oxidase [Parachlamydiales bacterium]|nr:protoporphyrinogen oxidase [Parachlamydiales bacterium]